MPEWDEFSERLRDLETVEFAPEIISPFLALPGLRGFWSMAAFRFNGECFDQSGNLRTLAYNGNPTYNYDGLVPYIDLDGTGDSLSRADEAGLDITGTEAYVAAAVRGLTLGGWFYPTEAGTLERLMSKMGPGGGTLAYALYLSAGNVFGSVISDDGTNLDTAVSGAIAMDAWYFVAGRFYPATSIDLLVNETWYTTATARASIFNTASDFVIGDADGGANPFNGRASLCFLCATALNDSIIESLFQQTRAAFGV